MPNLIKIFPDYSVENSYSNLTVVGIDEAGRGPLAGPVVAACVFLDAEFLRHEICKKINDSKLIEKKERKEIFLHLKKRVKFGVGIVDEKIIDEINILQATKLAMKQAYQNFCKKNKIFPQVILIDGNFVPFVKCDQVQEMRAIVKGDQKSLSIAAASIIAKETRDSIMMRLHKQYPHFAWHKNSAYATEFHLQRIKEFGFCEYHRKSFEPIKTMILNSDIL